MLAIAYTNYSFLILKYEFRVQFIKFNTDFKANRNFWVKNVHISISFGPTMRFTFRFRSESRRAKSSLVSSVWTQGRPLSKRSSLLSASAGSLSFHIWIHHYPTQIYISICIISSCRLLFDRNKKVWSK